MLQQAHFLMIVHDYHEALKAYCSYIANNPHDYEALIARSVAYYETGRFEDSVDDAEAAIIVDRERFQGYLRRGLSNFARGKVQSALADLEQAMTKTSGEGQKVIIDAIEKCKKELKNSQFSETPQRKVFTPTPVNPIASPPQQVQQQQ